MRGELSMNPSKKKIAEDIFPNVKFSNLTNLEIIISEEYTVAKLKEILPNIYSKDLLLSYKIVRKNKHTKDIEITYKEIVELIESHWYVLQSKISDERVILYCKARIPKEMFFAQEDTHFDRKKDRYQYGVLIKSIEFLKKRRTAIDIGGHVGFYSRALSEIFSNVIAFEPAPKNYESIKVNCPEIVVHNVALGSEEKEGEIVVFEDNSGNNYIKEGSGVKIKTLDSFGIKNVDLIKIDVQGYELEVLRGAKKTIVENKPIIIIELELNGEINHQATSFLEQECGYKIYTNAGKDSIVGPV